MWRRGAAAGRVSSRFSPARGETPLDKPQTAARCSPAAPPRRAQRGAPEANTADRALPAVSRALLRPAAPFPALAADSSAPRQPAQGGPAGALLYSPGPVKQPAPITGSCSGNTHRHDRHRPATAAFERRPTHRGSAPIGCDPHAQKP